MEKTSSFRQRRNFAQGIRIADFLEEYDLGGEVMPSCHKGMQILFATHRKSGTQVVVKIRMKRGSFKKAGEEEEWRENTEFMLSLPACTNIAQLYEVLEDEQAYYVVMEKIDGQDLFETISGQTLLPQGEVKEIMAQVLVGLARLHSQGIIHKDLKLENVMISRTRSNTSPTSTGLGIGTSISMHSTRTQATQESAETGPDDESIGSPVAVKLIDFDTVEEYTPMSPRCSRDVLGTDQYIAQEAYAGKYSFASDIFAAGVIAYRLCTGRFPYNNRMFDDKPGENWVGSPKMAEIRERLWNFKIEWNYPVFTSDPTTLELIKSMLSNEEGERPSARDALLHPWLANTFSVQEFRATAVGAAVLNGPAMASKASSAASTSLPVSRSPSGSSSSSPRRTAHKAAPPPALGLPSAICEEFRGSSTTRSDS